MKKKMSNVTVLSLLTSSFLLASSVQAQTPYYGKTYTQPPQVAKLYPHVQVPEQTPAFTKEGEAFTTQEELLTYISKLEKKSNHLLVKSIGQSQRGLDIPALYFTTEKDFSPMSFSKKPTVWLQAQIHGNEPASGEAALVIAERLTGKLGKEVLKDVNVIVVPRINPDGSYDFTRTLASKDDGNRDHIKLENKEVQAIHQEFNRYSPEVVIDAHEYTPTEKAFNEIGILKYHDILLLSGKNLNIPEKLRTYSDEVFVNPTHQKLRNQGFSSDNYYTSGTSTPEQIELAEGGTDSRIGRNAFGLHPSISFLVESRGIGIGREDFPRRVAAQVSTHEHIIKTAAKHAKELKKLVRKERIELVKKGLRVGDDDQVIINSKPTEKQNMSLPFVNIEKGEVTNLPVKYFSSSDAVPILTRERPTAYIVKPEYANVAEKLKNQGIKGFALSHETKIPVQTYQVIKKEQGEKVEGIDLVNVETTLENKSVTLPKGTFVFPTAQPQTNLLSLSLEPESIDSYVTFGFMPAEVGEELPFYRFMLDDQKLK
ncbi:M14 family metallopeptidase [Metabacillus iocasae]|uniref:Peptidase M14 domain-containing protein n=1 Tax=Priestia iocasae TaxID=2291674 RepID=A0ABS2QZL6_9BACI|nr:M14 family metallocarboxypeptidase [Metabacillus iocasae]MBM7703894.1 hypothetical protein [Metabacillus iocasae]